MKISHIFLGIMAVLCAIPAYLSSKYDWWVFSPSIILIMTFVIMVAYLLAHDYDLVTRTAGRDIPLEVPCFGILLFILVFLFVNIFSPPQFTRFETYDVPFNSAGQDHVAKVKYYLFIAEMPRVEKIEVYTDIDIRKLQPCWRKASEHVPRPDSNEGKLGQLKVYHYVLEQAPDNLWLYTIIRSRSSVNALLNGTT
jgi:hypothetical protein